MCARHRTKGVAGIMEPNQTAQMVAWLDEERRKDKALLSKLEERVASQTALIEDQARRIQALEGELTALRTRYSTIGFVDESIARLRTEMTTSIEQIEARRSSLVQDWKKMRDSDRGLLQKAIEDLRQEMLTRIERELQPRRTEEERLSRVAFELQNYADSLSKGLEEFEHSLSFLEEQRRQDARRLSELADLPKQLEGIDPKFELLEELTRRNERAIHDLAASLTDIRQERREWLEQQALTDQQREQLVQGLQRRIEAFAEEMDAHARQLESWSETHRLMRKNLEDFERLTDRIERRINEVTEIQRLSEERFRREWEEFLQEDQKRSRQFTLTNEESWRENNKIIEEIQARLALLVERSEILVEYVRQLRLQHRQLLVALAERYQTILQDYEDVSFPPLT